MKAWTWTTVLVLASAAVAADQAVLLTANGLENEKYSQYKKAPKVELKGAGYYATPAMLGEKGTAEALIPFRKGILTNGDSSQAWKRKPGPYTYWTGKKQGELFFVFGQSCRIERVRICLLFSKTSGCEEIRLYAGAKPSPVAAKVEGGQAPKALATIAKPKKKWNEIKDLNVTTDGLRFLLKRAPRMRYLHVTEVEVWGVPIEPARGMAAP